MRPPNRHRSDHPAPTDTLDRRQFLRRAAGLAGASALALAGCSGSDPTRYTDADRALLARQRELERARLLGGRFGSQVYRGYRGLSELPWFELDPQGVLRLVADEVPDSIDFHCHLGMSVLFEPDLDLTARTDRVRHLLDCDGTDPGCKLDLDIYINGNFTEEDLHDLTSTTLAQGLWGNDVIRTHTAANLLAEMDAMRVEKAILLPIVFDFPFGDDLEGQWRDAVEALDATTRLLMGTSVNTKDPNRVAQLEAAAARGARVVKLHPTVQAFYPDSPEAFDVYEAAERLGLIIFFHGGRAGIEPESRHRYAMPRHYEGAFANFPKLRFVVGHAGARDADAMLDLALRYDNVWLGTHGQGVSHFDEMIRRTGGERLLFGTDWPFYHLGASLAKVLIVTEDPGRRDIRHAILRGNAEQLLA